MTSQRRSACTGTPLLGDCCLDAHGDQCLEVMGLSVSSVQVAHVLPDIADGISLIIVRRVAVCAWVCVSERRCIHAAHAPHGGQHQNRHTPDGERGVGSMAGTVVVTPAAKATAGLSSSGAPVLTSSRPAAVSATPSATAGDGRAPWDPSATPPRCRVVLLPARVASSHLPPPSSLIAGPFPHS